MELSTELFSQFAEQGVIFVAFIFLLRWVLDTAKKDKADLLEMAKEDKAEVNRQATERENRLMDFIDGMKEELRVMSVAITKLGDDVEEVKSEIRSRKGNGE